MSTLSRVAATALVPVAFLLVTTRPAGADQQPSWQSAGSFRLSSSMPRLPRGARYLGPVRSELAVTGDVALSPRHPAALANFVAAVSDPASPDYRHYLAKGQFATDFGPSEATIDEVEQWLRAEGLDDLSVSADHLLVSFHTTAGQLSTAFSSPLDRFAVPSADSGPTQTSLSALEAPLVPRALASTVTAVLGLSSSPAQPMLEQSESAVAGRADAALMSLATASDESADPSETQGPTACPTAATAASKESAWTADEVAQAYGFPSIYSQGRLGQETTIGLLELAGYDAPDVGTYQSCFGTSATVTNVEVDGGPGASGGNAAAEEATIDIEAALSVAPQANILVYEAPDSLSAELDVWARMADDDVAQVVSTTWGYCEALLPSGAAAAEDTVLAQMAAQGQGVFAAAGDTGSEDCFGLDQSDTNLAVDDPGSQPYVTSVGGTSLTGDAANSPTESVWNNCQGDANDTCAVGNYNSGSADGAGGGGISQNWAMPSWQDGVEGSDSSGTPCGSTSGDCREVPDVAASADPQHGTVFYFTPESGPESGNSNYYEVGGTSVASPLWAGLVADLDSGCLTPGGGQGDTAGFINRTLYSWDEDNSDSANHDVTSGNNDYTDTNSGDYQAASGYDMASGWGSPDAPNLVTALEPSGGCATVTGLSVTSGGPGTSVTISGSDLGTATAVSFGSTATTSFTVNSSTSITATAPAGSGPVDVTVTTPNGTSGTDPADAYTLSGGASPPQTGPGASLGAPSTLDDPDLLTDPNFESGLGPWHVNAPNRAIYSSSSAPGGQYLEVVSANSVYQDVSVAVPTGHSYRASILLRSPTGTPVPATLVLWALGGSAAEIGQTALTVSGPNWTQYDTDVDVAGSGHGDLRLQLYFDDPGQQDLDLDGAMLQDAGVADAGFGQGLTPWQAAPGQNRAVYGSAAGPDGQFYLETNSGSASSPNVYQDVAVTPVAGDSYTAGVMLRSPSNTPIPITLVLWALGGSAPVEVGQTELTVGADGWAPYTTDLDVADSGHSLLRLQLYIGVTGVNLDMTGAWVEDAGVADAGFQQASLGPWSVTPGANAALQNGYGSASGADWLLTNTGGQQASSLWQDIATVPSPGRPYTASLMLQSVDGAPISVTLVLWALGGSAPVEAGQTQCTVSSTKSSPSWQVCSTELDVGYSGHGFLRLQLYLDTAGPTLAVSGAQLPDAAT